MAQTRGSTATPERADRPTGEKNPLSRGVAGVGLFYRQCVAELRKVIWPTREELGTYYLVVLVFVVALIVFVSLIDYGAGWAMFRVFG